MNARTALAAGALLCTSCNLFGPDDHFVIVGQIASAFGCQTLATSDRMYELRGLPPEFQVAGLQVRAEVRSAGEQASICMVGEIVEVISIRRR